MKLIHSKVEQCQLQIDDLIYLMDGASALSSLPFCQRLTSNTAEQLHFSAHRLFHLNRSKQISLLLTAVPIPEDKMQLNVC